MSNKYTGEVELTIGGKKGRLVYDWRAIAEIQTDHGKEVLSNIFGIDPAALAKLLAVGFKKYDPDITEEYILDNSPPLVPIRNAVAQAIAYAYYGADGVKEIAEKSKAEGKKAEKKTK